jgi:hypothetical protein
LVGGEAAQRFDAAPVAVDAAAQQEPSHDLFLAHAKMERQTPGTIPAATL